ncbi:MAG: hypothetical protein ACK4GT_00630 [Pararhodobacter sp.]
MSFALVVMYEAPDGTAVPEVEIAALRVLLAGVPALDEALIFTPASARDVYTDDGSSPPLGLQLLFARLEDLEAAAGPLRGLEGVLPSLAGTQVNAQAFWRRRYPVDAPWPRPAAGALPCSYVVHYPGPASDPDAWHAHYIAGHPPLFRRLPGIRGIEILTPVDWVNALPFKRARHMQRNRVLFDSPQALTEALHSPVRHELREDFKGFPPFENGNKHYPMWTETLRRN